MGWTEAVAAVSKIILWFLDWWREDHNETKQKKAELIKDGVNAVLSKDNQLFLLALRHYRNLFGMRQG